MRYGSLAGPRLTLGLAVSAHAQTVTGPAGQVSAPPDSAGTRHHACG